VSVLKPLSLDALLLILKMSSLKCLGRRASPSLV
jgi:hypothetical protein